MKLETLSMLISTMRVLQTDLSVYEDEATYNPYHNSTIVMMKLLYIPGLIFA